MNKTDAIERMLEVARTMEPGKVDEKWPCPLRKVFGVASWPSRFEDLFQVSCTPIFGAADDFRQTGQERHRQKCIAAIEALRGRP